MDTGFAVGNRNPNENDNVNNNSPQSSSPMLGTCLHDSMG